MKIVTGAFKNASPNDHPYRTEQGGIFIFPSMHLALSRRKMVSSNSETCHLRTPYEALNILLDSGFFKGRCVALAGGRGTHKSRLAFGQVLYTLDDDHKSRAIIISLREDESTVKGNFYKSLPPSMKVVNQKPEQLVDKLVEEGRLELCNYPPGFIAPEEFFHRVQLSVARQKQASPGGPVLLVFNSLDLLHSHYPLCAEHSIFVPALVELLCLENVTSFFVATSVENRDPYGLMSMADPVLRFLRLEEDENIVRMTIDRFAAGTSAGKSVFLALNEEGLHCYSGKPPTNTRAMAQNV